MKRWLLAGFICLWVSYGWAQTNELSRYFIYFKDKASTPFSVLEPQKFLSPTSLERRMRYNIPVNSRDLPVTPAYTAELKKQGATVWYTSRWFNGAVVQCDSVTYRKLQSLPFVKQSQIVRLSARKKTTQQGQQGQQAASGFKRKMAKNKNQAYGQAFSQAKLIGVPEMHEAGFRGEGIHIAVFDGGFSGVNRVPAFDHLLSEDRIKSTFDFVDKNTGVFEKDSHGTQVLSTLAANQTGTFTGTAPQATYSLFITENSRGEQHQEEINWLLAAELADSAGVDIIQSSLGYNIFDAPGPSYTYEDMNGNRTLVSRAADLAAATGMLVVVSAGNEGNNAWQHITAPADADSVLSIGATDSLGHKAIFSSIGPTADGQIKPDLSGQGLGAAVINPAGNVIRANGTSFSSPIICGLMAGFWQANRQLSNMQIMEYLKLSGTQASKPDNILGFGIPHFKRAQLLAEKNVKKNSSGYKLFPNPVTDNKFTVLVPISSGANTQVRIFNVLGQETNTFRYYYEKAQTNQAFLNLEVKDLAPGMYECVVTSLNSSETIRFLKQ